MHVYVNTNITRANDGGAVCKLCECRVNLVKVMFNRTEPYNTVPVTCLSSWPHHT